MMSSAIGSVSQWIGQIKSGQQSAAARLWRRYSDRMLRLARRNLNGAQCRVADEEDVVLSAFQSFVQRTQGGAFPDMQDRHDLWRLLGTITVHKALNVIRNENSERRGRDCAVLDGRVLPSDSSDGLDVLANLSGDFPEPRLIIMLKDSLHSLLTSLSDDELRTIAVGKLRGRSNEEIADEIGRSVATVERRLRLIRHAWQRELAD